MNYQYQSQADNNISALFEDEWFYGRRKSVLLKLVESFNKNGVRWSLLCSSQLFFYGIVDDFNDFDILIEKSSVDAMRKSMKELGAETKENGDQSCFDSTVFERYTIDGIDLDMVADFTVLTFGKRYRYSYNEWENSYILEQGVRIQLAPMEAQYLIYAMMEGWQKRRRLKRVMIENFLKSEGLKHPQIFKKALSEGDLPDFLKRKVRQLLSE